MALSSFKIAPVCQSWCDAPGSQPSSCMFCTASTSRPAAKIISSTPTTVKNRPILIRWPSRYITNAITIAIASPATAPASRPPRWLVENAIASVKTTVSTPSRPTAWKASNARPARALRLIVPSSSWPPLASPLPEAAPGSGRAPAGRGNPAAAPRLQLTLHPPGGRAHPERNVGEDGGGEQVRHGLEDRLDSRARIGGDREVGRQPAGAGQEERGRHPGQDITEMPPLATAIQIGQPDRGDHARLKALTQEYAERGEHPPQFPAMAF